MQSNKLKDLFIYEIDKRVVDKVFRYKKCFDRIELNLSIVSMSLIIDFIFDVESMIKLSQ